VGTVDGGIYEVNAIDIEFVFSKDSSHLSLIYQFLEKRKIKRRGKD